MEIIREKKFAVRDKHHILMVNKFVSGWKLLGANQTDSEKEIQEKFKAKRIRIPWTKCLNNKELRLNIVISISRYYNIYIYV